MVKRLFLTFVSSLFVVLILLQLVRFFTLSQSIEYVNYPDIYFSNTKYVYFMSFRNLFELQQFAPNIDINHYVDMFKAIGNMFKDVNNFKEAILTGIMIPLIPTLPLFAIIDIFYNLIAYVFAVLSYVFTFENTFTAVNYIDITGWVTDFINKLT